jgi:HSP20 family molecular chaperone IbpA
MGAMRKQSDQLFSEFERAIDEFFDELLIDRWQCGAGEQFADAEIVDHPDRYEIRLAAEGVDPEKIQVETLGRRLTVRASAGAHRNLVRAFTFAENVDAEAASARWLTGRLTITLPKEKARRIYLKDS